MKWDTVNFDWNQARAFLATVEEGSLSAAARAIGQTQPTLGRQISALEEQLDIVLFERIGKSLVLTQSGLELVDHARAMYDAANRISLTASGRSQAIEGRVCITASDVMAAHILPPAIELLRKKAPLLDIDIVASNAIQNLQLREADIAIRHVRPEEPDLIAKFICDATGNFFASKGFLAKNGYAQSLKELSRYDWVGFSDNDAMIEGLNGFGLNLTTENFRAGSESGLVLWELARQGLGVAVMSNHVAAKYDDMELVMPDLEPLEFPVWLTVHRELHTSRRIRLAFDLLSDFLKETMAKAP
jgi:DNA-binding transcriptional LysR family regulator